MRGIAIAPMKRKSVKSKIGSIGLIGRGCQYEGLRDKSSPTAV